MLTKTNDGGVARKGSMNATAIGALRCNQDVVRGVDEAHALASGNGSATSAVFPTPTPVGLGCMQPMQNMSRVFGSRERARGSGYCTAVEQREVARDLARANGNLSKVADLLGISWPTLYDLLNPFGLLKHE